MQDNGVVAISRQGHFSLKDAQQILPVLFRITQEYSEIVESRISRLETLDAANVDRISQLEAEINEHIKSWHAKVKKLGGVPKGLWLIDFDCGDGFFCWKYPEKSILYWHSYDEGYTKRIPISEWVKQKNQTPPPKPTKESLLNPEI